MTRVVFAMSALIISLILLVSGNAFLNTLLGLRLNIDQFSTATIGWVLVFYSVGFVVGTLYADRVIRRAGHIRAFAAFSALLACATLIYPMAVEPYLWSALRVVSGFAMAGLMIIVESWFSASATNRNRATLFAVYQVVFFIAVAGGQLLINLGNPADFMLFSLAAILISAALIPLSITRMEAPAIGPSIRVGFPAIYEVAATGLAGAILCGMLITGFYTMGPVYASQIGLPMDRISYFMAGSILAAMILAWPIGMLCDRFDRRRIMLITSLVAGVASFATAFLGQLMPALVLFTSALFVGLTAAIYPIAVAITNDRMESNQIVGASTTLLLAYGIGSCIGPVAGALMMDRLGPGGLFLGNSLMLFLLAGYVSNRIRHTTDVPVEDQEAFVMTTPEVAVGMAEMDPRNDENAITMDDIDGDLVGKHGY
ncbi:MAG: MFS transporter [Halomonadaceae bacterium]|nr:MAG: MFS transporter [Halomonadaceae bacterium]